MIAALIEEISKSRVRIVTDEAFSFVLYKSELRAFHIREGEQITQESIRSILEEVLPKRAKLRAMNLLKSREYTVKQLYDKLRAGGYPESAIEEALEYVGSFHYTDDLRYAVNFIQGHEAARSRRRIEQDLLGRGIDRATLEQAWAQWEESGGSQDEQAMIQALLLKRNYDPDSADRKEKQRIYGFLMRKGFSGEQVRRAIFAGDSYDWE